VWRDGVHELSGICTQVSVAVINTGSLQQELEIISGI
jgi:hypothetical protein